MAHTCEILLETCLAARCVTQGMATRLLLGEATDATNLLLGLGHFSLALDHFEV